MSFATDPRTPRRNPQRPHGRDRRRRGPRERGRPDHGRRTGQAVGHQLHGHPRARAGVPVADPRALPPARPAADGPGQHLAAPHQLHRQHRGGRRRDHRHLRLRPRPHHPHRGAPGRRSRRTCRSPGISSRSLPSRAACSIAPATPKRPRDLALLAGLEPAGVLVEILNADGSMARRPQLEEFARDARAEDRLHRGTDPLSPEHRAHRRARGRARDRYRTRPVPRCTPTATASATACISRCCAATPMPRCRPWCACTCRTRWPMRCIGGARISARR